MFKRSLFSVLLLTLFTFPLVLNAGSPGSAEPSSAMAACNLPAPGNLHAVSVGATEAVVAWNPVPGAWGYKVYITPSGNFQTASGITNGTSMGISNLAQGTTHTVTVYALCALGSQSNNSSQAQFTTIIIEIVCEASSRFTPNEEIGGSLNVFNNDWVSGGLYSFRVHDDNNNNAVIGEFKFDKTVVNNTTKFKFTPLDDNQVSIQLGRVLSTGTSVYCDGEGAPGIGRFTIKYGSTMVTTGTFISGTGLRFFPTTGYSMTVHALDNQRPGEPIRSKDRADASSPPTLTPAPNPFQDVLYLQGGHPTQAVQLALYDARGGLVRQQEVHPADFGAGAFALPTADLAPGIYFLQLRSEAGCTTHKLLKQ